MFVALINNFNPKYNLDFYELREYRNSPKMERKYYKEDNTAYHDAVAKFKQKKLKKQMKNLVRDVERYVNWRERLEK